VSDQKRQGKVYLVGAGPGDPGLITVRGANLVRRADVVVVDDLVNPVLFRFHPREKIIYVGKRGPGAPLGRRLQLPQKGISRLLVQLAKKGRHVVRLKGGDPLVFGRGGEEMEALRRAGVPYEVVPGVTSALAAPAYAGIPVSDRRSSSEVIFLTGQERREDASEKQSRIDWGKLSPEATLVILMGVSRWTVVRQRLLANGWPASKSVAAIESATTGKQRTILTTLSRSVDSFRKNKLVSPAVLVVGDVVQMARRLEWIKAEKPLIGKSVVVTRAAHQNRKMIDSLEEKGAHVLICPALTVLPVTDDPSSQRILSTLREESFDYDWIIFLSENGVRSFFAALKGKFRQPRSKVCAVGPNTAAVVEEFGWRVHKTARDYNRLGALRELGKVRGKKILLPRAQGAPQDIVQALVQRGARVDEIRIYRTEPAAPPPSEIRNAILSGVDAVTFTSPSTVRAFCTFFSRRQIDKIFLNSVALSIGRSTTEELKVAKIKSIVEADLATTDDMVETLVRRLKR